MNAGPLLGAAPLASDAALQRALHIVRQTLWTVGFFAFFVNLFALTTSVYMLQVSDRVLSSRSTHTLLYQSMVEEGKQSALGRDIARIKGVRDEITSRIAATNTAINEKAPRKFQVRKTFQEEATAELKKVQAESSELIELESTTKRTLELTELRAPVAGAITELQAHIVGSAVSPGEVLMEIMPRDDKLSVEARFLSQDIDRIATGQATDWATRSCRRVCKRTSSSGPANAPSLDI